MTVSPAGPAEWADALALLFGPDADAGHAFRMVARGELDPEDLLVARHGGAVIGAIFASRVPGAVAIVWPPRAVADDPAVADELTSAALVHVAGAKFVQAFLPPGEVGRATPLLRAGFRHVTRVWEMSLPLAATRSAGTSRLTAIPYPDCDRVIFHATLVRAHDDSLDCPELRGLLTADEMLAGYRDVAPDPGGWWLAVADDQPAGVLLMSGSELTFLGVVPERRGRGVGRRLLDWAIERAPGLTLIVDARNRPAIRLYQSAGLEVVGAREVFLYFPPPAADTTGPGGHRS